MHSLYLTTIPLHSSCGSSDRENSMHSSREAFSSLHTQQGLGFSAGLVSDEGFKEEARLSGRRGWDGAEGGDVC